MFATTMRNKLNSIWIRGDKPAFPKLSIGKIKVSAERERR